MSTVIELAGVGKRYAKLDEPATLLRSMLPFGRPARQELWALRELSFTLEAGETLGILGRNGAGKTTLLRLLAGVSSPTEGRLRIRGRIAPLISLGVGFHPEMSGRENVLINGLLLGMTRREVLQRYDAIVEFAGLSDFIDTPVKFYSSGMAMRLGFAVIAHAEPTVLLVDEILAVGDAAFQFKCFERLRSLQADGATIVMVSHSMPSVRQLCGRAILIRGGRVAFDGEIEQAIALHTTLDDAVTGGAVTLMEPHLGGLDADNAVEYDAPLNLHMRLRFDREVEDPVITVGVRTSAGLFGGFNATPPGDRWRTFAAGEEAAVRIAFSARFGRGDYRLVVEVKERTGAQALARLDTPAFTVLGGSCGDGLVDVLPRIEIVA